MKNLVIDKGCLILVNEDGTRAFVMSLGMVVGSLYVCAEAYAQNGRTYQKEQALHTAELIRESKEFHDWMEG